MQWSEGGGCQDGDWICWGTEKEKREGMRQDDIWERWEGCGERMGE